MRDEPTFFELDDALCVALYRAHRLMTNAYKPYLAPLNLTYTQFLTMICLWNRDKQSPTEIGETLQLDSGTITPLIKRLINLGHVKKERSKIDERKLVISLTDSGKKLKEKSSSIPMDMLRELNMSEAEFVKIRTGIKTVIANLSSGESL